jgi:hypothetical protein
MEPSMVTSASLFSGVNLLALAGWAVLAVGIAARSPLLERLAGQLVPLALSAGYTALIGVHWSSADGGFGSLPDVAALFESPGMLLAGWIHYLAFDLFVGAWIAGDVRERALPRWLLLPVLPAVFLFGPAGLLLWFGIRTACRARALSSTPEGFAHVR